MKNVLYSIRVLRKIMSCNSRVKRKPYRPGEVAVKEQVSVIFYGTTRVAVLVNMVGIPGSSLCSGEGTTNQPPGEGFDYGREAFRFPCSL